MSQKMYQKPSISNCVYRFEWIESINAIRIYAPKKTTNKNVSQAVRRVETTPERRRKGPRNRAFLIVFMNLGSVFGCTKIDQHD